MTSVIAAAAALPLLILSFSDLRWRRIPNLCVLALVVIALVRMGFAFSPFDAAYDVGTALAVFLVLVAAWARQALGAGDVKLVGASVLLVGHAELLSFLVLTAMLGGALAMLVLADTWLEKYYAVNLRIAYPAGAPGNDTPSPRPSVPYGIAIAAACLLTLVLPLFG